MIHDISYKTLIGLKPLRITFDKTDEFIRICDGTRCLVLFGPEKYHAIYNRIRHLTSLKSSITYIFSRYYTKIKVDSYDSLTIEKRLTLHNVIILIKVWDFNVDNIVISKLIETKTNSKYLIGYLDKVIRQFGFIMPKMSKYVTTFKVKDGDKHKNNKLISFPTPSPAHLFPVRGRRKRGPGTLQTRDQNFPK